MTKALRSKLETLGSEDIRRSVVQEGWEETMRQISANKEELEWLAKEKPEDFEKFREAQLKAEMNMNVGRAVDAVAGAEEAIE